MDQDATWYDCRPRPENIVLDADPAPPPRGTAPAQLSAHVCCSQMARWIKMPLGTKVGLSPGRIVLHGDPARPPQKGHNPPIFGPCLLCSNGWMDEDATWYRGRPRPKRHCVRWGPSSQGQSPPIFGPMSIVAKRLHGSRCHLVWW